MEYTTQTGLLHQHPQFSFQGRDGVQLILMAKAVDPSHKNILMNLPPQQLHQVSMFPSDMSNSAYVQFVFYFFSIEERRVDSNHSSSRRSGAGCSHLEAGARINTQRGEGSH